jgi:hypothetical protein
VKWAQTQPDGNCYPLPCNQLLEGKTVERWKGTVSFSCYTRLKFYSCTETHISAGLQIWEKNSDENVLGWEVSLKIQNIKNEVSKVFYLIPVGSQCQAYFWNPKCKSNTGHIITAVTSLLVESLVRALFILLPSHQTCRERNFTLKKQK